LLHDFGLHTENRSAVTREDRYLRPLLPDAKGVRRRSISELLERVQEIVADGVVIEDEADFLRRWIIENEAVRDTWPANALYLRIEAMLSDGVLDPDEQHELLATMLRFVEQRRVAEMNRAAVDALLDDAPEPFEELPYDPEPRIVHVGKSFVLIGAFASGATAGIESRIRQLGGTLAREVSARVDFVVVGGLEAGGADDEVHARLRLRGTSPAR
jgi:hypothetical protein